MLHNGGCSAVHLLRFRPVIGPVCVRTPSGILRFLPGHSAVNVPSHKVLGRFGNRESFQDRCRGYRFVIYSPEKAFHRQTIHMAFCSGRPASQHRGIPKTELFLLPEYSQTVRQIRTASGSTQAEKKIPYHERLFTVPPGINRFSVSLLSCAVIYTVC